MAKIITTSEVQRNIGQISKSIDKESYIVTSHGKGRMVVLPYFDGCDENLFEYMEDYEMVQNQAVLKQRYQDSSQSGESDLSV